MTNAQWVGTVMVTGSFALAIAGMAWMVIDMAGWRVALGSLALACCIVGVPLVGALLAAGVVG